MWVPAGTVSDLAGNVNRELSAVTVKYRPKSGGLEGAAIAANALLGTSVALCTAASYAHSALLPFAHGALGCGALGFVGWGQALYLSGRLSAQWMPENYLQVSDMFAWTVGDLGLSWADSMPEMDPALAFPFAPVVLTSTGQEVSARAYPALTSGDAALAGGPLLAVTGRLEDVGGSTPASGLVSA